MRVLLSTYGSRGDVEPMAALAAALQAMGAEAMVSAPGDQEFAELLSRARVKLAPALMPVRQWIAEKSKLARTDFTSIVAEMLAGQFDSISAAADGCDVIVATGLFPSVAAARCVAEKLGVRYVHVALCPLYLPSDHHPPPAFPGHPLPPGVTDNRALWRHNAETMNALFGGALNAHRASIGLSPVKNARDHVFTHRPWLASDPALWPWQPTDLCEPVHPGAWILTDDRPLPADLVEFLQAGEPPVYAGFGSMAMNGSAGVARAAIESIRRHGRRTILARGWAELTPIDDQGDCFVVADVKQQALFPKLAAVIHHGGAGTTTAAACAGVPQVIVPQVADQPYWARQVAKLGAGVAHDGSTPTADSLSDALEMALGVEAGVRAKALARAMRTDGAAMAAKLLLDERPV